MVGIFRKIKTYSYPSTQVIADQTGGKEVGKIFLSDCVLEQG